MKKESVNIIVPVYNNSNSIESICNFVNEADFIHSVCFVDDASTDGSQDLIKNLSEVSQKIKYIFLQKNSGQVIAIEAGLQFCDSDACIILSADLQEPISLIEKMINIWQSGAEVVIVYRASRKDGWINKCISSLFYYLIKLNIPAMPTGGFDYCLVDRKVVKYLNTIEYRNRFLQGDVMSAGFSIRLLPYERSKGIVSHRRLVNNFNFKVKYFIDGILHTGIFPIRVISILGLMTTSFALLYSFIIVIEWLKGNAPFEGWPPIMISILFTAGIILLTLGVLGEYIWRIYDEVKKASKFVVKETNLNKEYD